MDIVQDLQQLRKELIEEIDTRIEQVIKKVKTEQISTQKRTASTEKNYESLYPLHAGTGIFKGKRPTGVILSNGIRQKCPTWKSIAEALLKDCCNDSQKKQALMDLRGKVLGRNRVLLGSEAGTMRSPLKIDEALYMETHYDAEALLRILTTRILDAAGYDYSQIRIAVQAE